MLCWAWCNCIFKPGSRAQAVLHVNTTGGDPLGISLMYLHDVIPSLAFNFSLVLWWYDLDDQLQHTYPHYTTKQVYLISPKMTISCIASYGYCETLCICPHYGVIHTFIPYIAKMRWFWWWSDEMTLPHRTFMDMLFVNNVYDVVAIVEQWQAGCGE